MTISRSALYRREVVADPIEALREVLTHATEPLPDPDHLLRPTMLQIKRQFNALDGSTHDQLYIEGTLSDGTEFWAGVDDGTGGDVVFEVHTRGETFYVVGDEPKGDEPTYALITSGGQQTDTFTRWVVNVHVAARALWFFLASGELDPGLRWDALSESDFCPPPDKARATLPRRK